MNSLKKILILFILSTLFIGINVQGQNIDSLANKKILQYEKRIKELEDLVFNSQAVNYKVQDATIKSINSAQENSLKSINIIYSIITTLIAVVVFLLGGGAYAIIKALKHIRRFSEEQVNKYIEKNFSPYGIDSENYHKQFRSILNNQLFYYQLFQLQGNEEQMKYALDFFKSSNNQTDPLLFGMLEKIIDTVDNMQIIIDSLIVIIINKSPINICNKAKNKLLEVKANGLDNDKKLAEEAITFLKNKYDITVV